MAKVIKRIALVVLCFVLVLALVVGGYVVYLTVQYYRIEDKQALAVQNGAAAPLQRGASYTALTYNIGFGAYNHDFSFFMDTGEMADGTAVGGAKARAHSEQAVLDNTAGAIAAMQAAQADFVLLQEVDEAADRSWKVNQVQAVRSALPDYGAVFAQNFHSGYLAYPLFETHGRVESSGLLSLSRYAIDDAVRRSLPVDESFPTKFFDLDRCFAVMRLPVEGGGELVLINIHMSAYDEGGLVRAAQLEMLNGLLAAERAAGNWVVVGGDYNHALCGTVEAFLGGQKVPGWVSVLGEGDLAEGYSVVCPDNVTAVATCRSTDMPYVQGVNYEVVVDGFIVSDNVRATAENVDAGFLYSDHNPVKLVFTLQ